MKCPILKVHLPYKACRVSECIYNSSKNEKGCIYGQHISAFSIASHKDIPIATLRKEMRIKEVIFARRVTLYRYFNFVQPSSREREGDLEAYYKMVSMSPYNTQIFQYMTKAHVSRMRRRSAFRKFCRANGIDRKNLLSRYEDLDDFLMRNDSPTQLNLTTENKNDSFRRNDDT